MLSEIRWFAPLLSSALQTEVRLATGPYVYCPALTDELVPEAESALASYRQSLHPASSREIREMLGTIALIYPPARISDVEAEARIRLFVDLLSDLPRDGLAYAFREWACTGRFFPTPAEIRVLASEYLKPRTKMIHTLECLLMKTREEWLLAERRHRADASLK